jgi:hypothetical protein
MARVGKPLSATPLTTRLEGKCKDITSDHSEWGQVPTPLNEFAQFFHCQPLSEDDASIFLQVSRHWASESESESDMPYFSSFHIHIHSLHLPTLVFARHHSKLQLFISIRDW